MRTDRHPRPPPPSQPITGEQPPSGKNRQNAVAEGRNSLENALSEEKMAAILAAMLDFLRMSELHPGNKGPALEKTIA